MKLTGPSDAADHIASRLAAGALPEPRVVLAVGEDSLPLAQAVGERIGASRTVAPSVAHLVLPWYPQIAFGALTADNHHYIDPVITADHALGTREVAQLCRDRLKTLRGPTWRAAGAPANALPAPVTVIVARALSTGYRALALAASATAFGAAQVVVVAPCGARDAVDRVSAAHTTLVLHASDGPRFDPDECWPLETDAA